MKDQQAYLDFAYLANAQVATLAKQLVAQYYGKPAAFSYFSGCSTGGREGMILSQRYPTSLTELFRVIPPCAPDFPTWRSASGSPSRSTRLRQKTQMANRSSRRLSPTADRKMISGRAPGAV